MGAPLSSGKKAKVVTQELGVSDWSLSRWRLELELNHESPTTTPSPTASSDMNALELAKENGGLRREVEALTRQREVFKGYFHLFSGRSERRFEVIETLIASEPEFMAATTMRQACAALSVSESGFYAHCRKAERPRR